MDNLPLPDFIHIFDDLIALCKNFKTAFDQLLDKTAYYQDICMLIDACRFLCPQDIIIMMQSLQFDMAHTIKLSLKLDIDFISFIGILLFPLFLILYMLFDTLGSIAVKPMDCTMQYLLTFKETMESTVEGTKNFSPGKIGADISLPGGMSYGAEIDKSSSKEASATVHSNDGWKKEDEEGNLPETKIQKASTDNLPKEPDKLAKMLEEMNKQLGSFDSLLLRVADVQVKIKEFSEIWKKSTQASLDMITKEMADKMSLVLAIMQIVRTIEFLGGMLKALKENEVCIDPKKPLSPTDLENVLKNIPTLNVNDTNKKPGTISLILDPVTGVISIPNTSGRMVVLPTCIGKVPEVLKQDIEQWVRELDGAVV